MADKENIFDVRWRDIAMFMAGLGAGLITLLVVPTDIWLHTIKNVGPISYFGGMAILFADRFLR